MPLRRSLGRVDLIGKMFGLVPASTSSYDDWMDGETFESYFGKTPRPSQRSFRRQFAEERKQTELLFRGLHLALDSEMKALERRLVSKLEGIDTSLNLIAAELARHGNKQPRRGRSDHRKTA